MTGHLESLALRGAGRLPAGLTAVSPRPRPRFDAAPAGAEISGAGAPAAEPEPAVWVPFAPADPAPAAGPADRAPMRQPIRVRDTPVDGISPRLHRGDAAITAAPLPDQAEDARGGRLRDLVAGAVPARPIAEPPPPLEPRVTAPRSLRGPHVESPTRDPRPVAPLERHPAPPAPAASPLPVPPQERGTPERPRAGPPPLAPRASPGPPREVAAPLVSIGRIEVLVEPPAPPPAAGPERTRGFASYARARRGALR